MHYSELVLQGVRKFAQMQRIPLGQGFSVFFAGSGGGKSTVVDVVVHLLYPNPTEPASTEFQASPGTPCRVSLTLDQGADKYRLVKDLTSGSIALTRMDPASGRFAMVTSAAAEILQFLTSQLHLPQRDILESVYIARDSALPSNMPRIGAPPGGMSAKRPASAPQRRLPPSPHFPGGGGGAAAGGVSFPGYQGMDPGEDILPDDPEEIKRQIETLEQDLAAAKDTDDLQFKLDGLQSEMFEIDQKFKGTREVTDRVKQLEAGMQEFASLTELPDNFEKKVREFEKSSQKLKHDLKRLEDDKERWEKRARMSTPEPLRKNRLFLVSLLLGVLALGAGVAGFYVYEPLRYVALLDILAFGVATVVAIRHIDLLSTLERASRRLGRVDERREKIERTFELETSMVRRTMMELKVEQPGQIIEQYNKHNKLQQEIDAARKQLENKRKDNPLDTVESRRNELQKQIDEIEAQLVGVGGMMMHPREMEQKIDALRGKLQRIESGEPASDFGQADGYLGAPAGDDPYGLGVGAPPGQAMPSYGEVDLASSPAADPCQTLVKASEDLFLTGRERVEQTLQPRASQYIAALTNQAYPQLAFGPGGLIQVMDSGSGSAVDFSMLPAAVQDLVYLGLKFSIIELYSRQQPVPLLLDDPFKRIPPDKHAMLGQILAGLGKLTQVILFTGQMTLAQHATASFRL